MKIRHHTLILLMSWMPVIATSKSHLPSEIKKHDTHYQICDSFTLRYGFVIKVAEIGWYSLNCNATKPVLQASDKIIRFHYFKNVGADFFKESAEEYFLKNIDNHAAYEPMKKTLIQFNAGYVDIESGDFFDLVHLNGLNLSLFKNNKLLVTVTDEYFSKAYFNIWFGEFPVIEKLKRAFNE